MLQLYTVGCWATYGKYSELVDIPCFQHGEAEILRFLEMAKKCQYGWSKWPDILSDIAV